MVVYKEIFYVILTNCNCEINRTNGKKFHCLDQSHHQSDQKETTLVAVKLNFLYD